MKDFTDSSAPVRPGEELDLFKLEQYLRDSLGIETGQLSVEQFPGGHSNLTYLVKLGDRELVLRRPPFGTTVKSAHDMGREYHVLSKLHDLYPPAPEPILFCEDESILGAKFYAMERRRGIVFRVNKPDGLELSAEDVHGICRSFIENLGRLHSIDYREAGLEDLYRGPGYIERQVRGWTKRWQNAATESVPAMDKAAAWLEDHLPEDTDATIIHNDYKFDNLMFDSDDVTKLVGVFDWEMATIGDPLSDLAATLSSYVAPDPSVAYNVGQCFLVAAPGAMTREELAGVYSEMTGRDVGNLHYHVVLSQFKGAVMLQQIYYRYHHGLTHDERFAPLIHVVRGIAKRTEETIETGEY